MKVWIGFMLLMFMLGGWEFRNQRPAKFVLVLGICVGTTLLFRSYRFV
jgi:hypothetical protein